jgi:hypothetical protein
MRIEEMHLLNAEAKSRLGNDSDARVVLKKSINNKKCGRSLFRCYVRNYMQKKEIYLQTRIEFWGEGKSYLAMKRKATTTRGSNHLFFAGDSSNIMMLN